MSQNLYSLVTDINEESVAKLPSGARMFLNDYSASIASGVTAIKNVCDNYGHSLTAIQQYRAKYKEFSAVLTKLRKYADSVELAKLEQVSQENAENPRSVTERIFRLKSLDASRYSDKRQVNHSGEINISFGLGVVGYASSASTPQEKEIKSTIKASTDKQSKQSKHSRHKSKKFSASIGNSVSNIKARADK